MGWREKAKRAKRLHRPSLKNWECDGLYETFPAYVRSVTESSPYQSFIPFERRQNSNSGDSFHHATHIPAVLDAKRLPPKVFVEDYEAKSIPCVISNVPAGFDVHPRRSLSGQRLRSDRDKTNDKGEESKEEKEEKKISPGLLEWPAVRRWDLEALESDPDLKDRSFKCGEDDDGKSVRIKLKHFMRYLHETRDDSPLYIFDSTFDEDRLAKRLLSDYRVPEYFKEDLFHLVGEKRRPPYRWFLVGPKRSGTCVHIDPLATSAWNTLIHGTKRWVLFPPHTPKSIVKGKGLIKKDEDDEAIHYFMTILPRIKQRAAESDGTGDYENFQCYEFTQNAGETVYIPNGWWHAVLNISDTVGITQNFCSQQNFEDVWIKTRSGRKKMAYKWLLQLDEHYPHLAKIARKLNKRDDFVMRYDPAEVKKREKEKARKRRARKEAKAAAREKSRKMKREKRRSSQGDSSESEQSDNESVVRSAHPPQSEAFYRDSKRSRFDSNYISP